MSANLLDSRTGARDPHPERRAADGRKRRHRHRAPEPRRVRHRRAVCRRRGVSVRAFPALHQPDAVQPRRQHRLSVHGHHRRRRVAVGCAAGRGSGGGAARSVQRLDPAHHRPRRRFRGAGVQPRRHPAAATRAGRVCCRCCCACRRARRAAPADGRLGRRLSAAGGRNRGDPRSVADADSRATELLAVEAVSRYFGGLAANRDVSFAVHAQRDRRADRPERRRQDNAVQRHQRRAAAQCRPHPPVRRRRAASAAAAHRRPGRRAHVPACEAAADAQRAGEHRARRASVGPRRPAARDAAPRSRRGSAPARRGAARRRSRLGLGAVLDDAGRRSAAGPAARGGDRPRAVPAPAPAAARRTGRRAAAAGEAAPRRPAAAVARRGHGRAAGRARHGLRHAAGRPRRGDGFRPEDRRRAARAGAVRSRRDGSLSRRRRHDRRRCCGSTACAPATAMWRCCTASACRCRKARWSPSSGRTAPARRR